MLKLQSCTLQTVLWIHILDPDPELRLNLVPDPGLCFQYWTKKFKIVKRKTLFFKKYVYFKLHKKIISSEELFKPVAQFYPISTCWDTDPDPQGSWIRIQYGSGSTILAAANVLSVLCVVCTPWLPSCSHDGLANSHVTSFCNFGDVVAHWQRSRLPRQGSRVRIQHLSRWKILRTDESLCVL